MSRLMESFGQHQPGRAGRFSCPLKQGVWPGECFGNSASFKLTILSIITYFVCANLIGRFEKMQKYFLTDAIFQARKPILSLPVWHGARWSAWLRLACARINIDLNSIFSGILPFRKGQKPIDSGELVILRLVANENLPEFLPSLAKAIKSINNSGQFSAASLELLGFRDAINGKLYKNTDHPSNYGFTPLNDSLLEREFTAMQALDQWQLQFTSPLRLKLPPGLKGHKKEVDAYCGPEFFSTASSLNHLLNKVRGIERPIALPAMNFRLKPLKLLWDDMRYNASRQIALGGVTGKIEVYGKPDAEIARRLVLGQYLGAGKNPLFGLGYWQIPELEGKHALSLPREEASATLL